MAFDERYLNNRLKYHTASRLPKQAGDSLAASFNADGHTVTTKQVWASAAEEFPFQSLGPGGKASVSNDPVGGTTNLIEVFKDGGVSAAFWNGGKVWTNELYPAVKLYENVPATAVNGADSDWPAGGTSGKTAYFQSFEILASENGVTSGTIRVSDWVNPVSVNDPLTSAPEAGFTGIFKWDGTTLQDDTNWTLDKSNWEFVYTAGLLTFEYNAAPEKVKSKKYSAGDTTLLTITAFKYDGTYLTDVLSGYSTPLAISSEFKNVRELITNVQSEALGIEAGNGIVFGSNISGDTVINVDITNDDKVLSFSDTGLSTTISLVKLSSPTSGYAASYQLQGLNGTVLGDTINIAKDQFLKGAEITEGAMISGKFTSKSEIEKLPEDEQVETEKFIHFTFEINKKDEHGKVTSDENNVYLNIHELIDVYTGGNAIEVTSDNVINLVKSNKSEDFFFVDSTGAGVSGIQTAIDLAASGLISGVAEIPTTTAGFEYNTLVFTADGETAIIDVVNNKVVDISEENVETITATTLSSSLPTVSALTGYVDSKVSTAKDYADANFLKEVEVSGAQALSVTQKDKNKQTISLAISTQSGNAIVDATTGLFVQKYVAGENITLSANADGEMTINGSNSYVLSAATETTLGGVKAGADISVDNDGDVTVLQAEKVKHTLTAGTKNFDGLENIEILASDLGALTSVTAGTGIAVSTKSDDSQSISLDLKSDDKYLTLSGNALASKGIDEAIEAASSEIINDWIAPIVSGLSDEISARISGDTFISGTLLSGYSPSSTVKMAEEALDLRLDAVEAQLGLGGGGNGNSSVTERLYEVEKTISAYTSTNTISSAISSISGNVGSLLPLLGLQIEEADASAGYAATYRLADRSGKQYGSLINIPKDQFLSGAEYDVKTKSLKLTFALNGIDANGFPTVSGQVATIPVADFVETYTAGSGITLSNNEFSLVTDNNSDTSKYLVIGNNTIGLSGVTDAIEYAVKTKAQLADYTANGTAASGTIQYAIRQNTAAIATLNGDKDTVGSVDYKIDQYDLLLESLVTSIELFNDEIDGKTNGNIE